MWAIEINRLFLALSCSNSGHARKLSVTLGQAVVFAGYSSFLQHLQLAIVITWPQYGISQVQRGAASTLIYVLRYVFPFIQY